MSTPPASQSGPPTPATTTSPRPHRPTISAPLRRESFDRSPADNFSCLDTSMKPLDTTPRRFSTGAAAVPLPAPQVLVAQAAAEMEREEQDRKLRAAGGGAGDAAQWGRERGYSGAATPKDNHDLSAAINRFQFCATPTATPSMARLAALTSPCFFHRRFGDAVDIDKVLDEVRADDQLSHSRLMQTAASVREVSRQLQRRPLKREVRNVMVVTKARDNQLVTLTRELAKWLLATPRYGRDVGVNVWVDAKLKKSRRFGADSLAEEGGGRYKEMLRFWTPELCLERPELFDLVITLGGDGTVLFTSWLFQRIVPPVLSFALGSLGFLTNFEFGRYKDELDRVMGETGMRVNMRMRFTATVYRAGHASTTDPPSSTPSLSNTTTSTTASSPTNAYPPPDKTEAETHEVLNELVIDRGPSSYISSLDLYAHDTLLTRISADGVILSTPTGSTAYSLSAGGSLVHPDIPAILLTPICPHTLSFRPMLLNDDTPLKVALPAEGRGTAFVSFDGKGRVELRRGDEVVVRASQFPFPTVMGRGLEWFESLSRTLRWNVRAAEQKGWGEERNDGDEGFELDFEGDQGEEGKEAQGDGSVAG